jgi:hypothetical protein
MRHMLGTYIEIWPSELGDVGVPVWGDKIIIRPDAKHFPTMCVGTKQAKVLLGSLPKTPVSGRSLRTLLIAASGIRLQLTKKCTAGRLSQASAEVVGVEIKTALEHYRSILDYVAHDIHRMCRLPPRSSKPQKLYFPIASPKESNADFHRRFQKDYPQLRNTAPKLFKHIIDIQWHAGDTWLRDLAALVNPMKHHQLAQWEEIECKSLVIHHGGVGIRIGELGIHTISIPKNQEIHFVSPMGVEKAIRGPQELHIDTVTLNDADPEIQLDLLTWKTTAIKGTSRSIAGLLAEIDGGVRNVLLEVTRALHP